MKKQRRFEPWPIGIIAFYSVFATTFIGFAIIVSSSLKFDLVSKDYYEKELRYEEHLQAVRRATALAHQPVIDVGQQVATVTLPDAWAADATDVRLVWYRPDNAKLDRIDALEFEQGVAETRLPQPGRWMVTLRWNLGDEEHLVEQHHILYGAKRP